MVKSFFSSFVRLQRTELMFCKIWWICDRKIGSLPRTYLIISWRWVLLNCDTSLVKILQNWSIFTMSVPTSLTHSLNAWQRLQGSCAIVLGFIIWMMRFKLVWRSAIKLMTTGKENLIFRTTFWYFKNSWYFYKFWTVYEFKKMYPKYLRFLFSALFIFTGWQHSCMSENFGISKCHMWLQVME